MKIQNQKFITKTDLFEGFDEIEAWWNEEDHSDFTWGDCCRSMVSAHDILGTLPLWVDVAEHCPNTTEEDWGRFMNQLVTIPHDVMIDLEN